ncbi:MAG: hypothetical protein ACO3F5_10220 [Gemmatimonadaceae bacterium]
MTSCPLRHGGIGRVGLAVVTIALGGLAETTGAQGAGQPGSPSASAPTATLGASTNQPSASALIARHDSLVGGRAAFEGLTSMRLTGTFGVPMVGLEAPLEIVKVKPNRFLLRTTLGPMGELLTGHDGTIAWSIQPGQGPRVLEGAEAAMMASQADFFADLHDLNQFTSLTVLPTERFEGRETYPVRLVRRTGEVLTEYFDAATGLSAGVRTSVEGPQGAMEVVAVLADYQRFGSLLLPTTRLQRTSMLETVLRISAVEFDRADAAATQPPESIRSQVRPAP